jgi:hypothetical protein
MKQRITNADNILFRASQMTDVMSGVATKKDVENSETCKKRLVKIYNEVYYGRKEANRDNKYCEKGTIQEKEGISLLILNQKKMYKKNETRHSNDFFTCITDINDLPDTTIDIKCSWSLDTFNEAKTSDLKKVYLYQGQVQMDVHGKNNHWVVYCLVNNTPKSIQKEIDYLKYKFEEGSPNWENAARQVQINHIFDMKRFVESIEKNNEYFEYIISPEQWKEEELDISASERIFRFEMTRNDEIISSMKNRINECRAWMNEKLFKVNGL